MRTSTRLDPVGRLRLPRRSTTLRALAVAMLLLIAAGVLYAGGGAGPAVSGTTGAVESAALPGAPEAAESAMPPAVPETATAPTPGLLPAGGERLPIPPGLVGVPVPLGGPTTLAVLRPGDRVDLFAVPASGGDPVPVAEDASVLAVDPGSAAILLALDPEQARHVIAAPAATRFAVILRG